jgi:hypothetical protein
MQGNNIGGFTNQNGDQDRLRRQQIIRLGVVICLILMLLQSSQFTAGPAVKTTSSSNSNNGVSNANSLPHDFTTQLNMISKGSSQVDGLDQLIYPRNLTGMFKGNWKTDSGIRNLNDIENSNNAFTSGKLLMQLRSVTIPNVNDLYFIYGVIKLYGAGPRMTDMLLPIQGISLPNFGIVNLMITPYKTQKLVLQLPAGNITSSINNSALIDKSLNSSSSIVSMNYTGIELNNNTNSSLLQLSSKIRRNLFHNDIVSLDQYYNNENLNLHKLQKRKLSKSDLILNGEIISIPIGITGMILHLVDGTKNVITKRNDTQYLVSLIGENALPLAFKNLQDIVIQGNRTYYLPTCLQSVKLASKPLQFGNVNDLNEKISKSNEVSISISMNGLIESSNCAIAYNVSVTSFILPLDILDKKARHYSFIAILVCMIQIALLVMQSRYAQNQAAASKISITGICALSLLDAALCIVHFLMCTILPKIFFAYFMWIAVLKLLMFCVFEMRTVVMIYQARFAQELSTEGWHGLRRRLASLHLRFYVSLFVMMFLAFIFYSKPKILIVIFYSFWWPQIYHNVSAGTRKPFNLLYLWGTAISRLFIPLYFIGCPNNFLHILLDQSLFEASFSSCIFLVFWVFLQASILTAQDIYGSRFFVPSYFLPTRYDYFRYVNANTLRSSSIQDTVEQDIENGNLCECVICYNGIQLISGSYMITPCDHLFHKECLQNWLEIKLECPTCRYALPALE